MFDSPLTAPQRRRLWIRLTIRLALMLTAGLALALVPLLFALFAPFVCALVAAAVLNPAIRLLQHRLGWGRGIFTLLVLGGVVAGLGGGLFALCYVAAGELTSLAAGWETVLLQITQVAERLDRLLDKLWQAVPPALSSGVDALYNQLILWLRDFAPLLMERAANWTGQAVGGIPSFLLALLFFVLATYFLTADYPYLRTRLVSHLDDGTLHLSQLVHQTALAAFGGYLKAQFLLSVGVFFILLAGFFLIAQPYGMLMALGLAVLDFIPILGAGTVMVPWAFVALLSGEGGTGLEILLIWGVVALFRRVAEPKFVGNQTGLSPVLSLCSIYVGLQLGGVLGMIVGPILLLILLNLSSFGLFRGLWNDCVTATRDIAAFLSAP